MVLGVLGYKIFVPIIEKETPETNDPKDVDLTLYLSRTSRKSNRLIEANCKRTNEGYVVLKGSMIEENDSKAIPKTIKDLRDKCKKEQEIINGKIEKNFLFNSPSYAAAFVLGMNTNGRTDWKTVEGITLKDLEEKELQE